MLRFILSRERSDDIEPRSAPCATPTAPKTRHAAPARAVSPLSILAPSLGGSILAPSYAGSIVGSRGRRTARSGEEKEEGEISGKESTQGSIPPTRPDQDPTYPPNPLLSPPFMRSPYDPRFMFPRDQGDMYGPHPGSDGYNGAHARPGSDAYGAQARQGGEAYGAHSRQGSDPYMGGGVHSPISPYYPYPPYVDPMRCVPTIYLVIANVVDVTCIFIQ